MASRSNANQAFSAIRTEGAILPAELLQRILAGDSSVPGLSSDAYHLAGNERLNEAATRAWNRLTGVWESFRTSMEELPEDVPGTTETRRWLLILFQELGYGRLQRQDAVEIEGRAYPVSHGATEPVPIHLVSCRQELDRRTPGRAGAARVSPHSLVQEFLNRSDGHLWGFVSNGVKLRVLRDNVSLTRMAYVEFDLEAMFEGNTYSDFFLLYLLCHQSRVEVGQDGDTGKPKPPATCWLEKWYDTAVTEGVRFLEELRGGVESAIEALGGGFLAHPANRELRDRLRSGGFTTLDYYRQVLREVYRLLFLFVAEDRDLLLAPDAPHGVGEVFTRYYSTARLRGMAGKRRGTRHGDLWQQLNLVFGKLRQGCPELGLPALGSFLFSPEATPDLDACLLANSSLLAVLRHLTYTTRNNVLQPVSYRNLGPEELGSVYESLLEMHPQIHLESARFDLEVAAGSERKTTGSYYTPSSLVNCLLDSALDPVLDDAVKGAGEHGKLPTAEERVLALKVCDPACGSGHFLIAAAHRIAKRLAAVRSGEDEPSPAGVQHALRDVIGHCIYGVDINPMAVELCKVSLWLEALEPGRPLSFLDHHIQCGNSLIGCTPALLERGIPDDAFKAIEGDDKAFCTELRKRNRDERKGQDNFLGDLFMVAEEPAPYGTDLGVRMTEIDAVDDTTIEAIQAKEKTFRQLQDSEEYRNARLACDLWCAAFVWQKVATAELPYPPTEQVLRQVERKPAECPGWMQAEASRLGAEYQFFHWHLAFPDVFQPVHPADIEEEDATGWSGGFDLMVGNPPWVRQETLKPIKTVLGVFRTYSSTADSSVYFLERSVSICRLNGHVAMLTPNKWFRASYARSLRAFLRQRCLVEMIVDFGHSRSLFPSADTFPAAVCLSPVECRVSDTRTACFVEAHDSERASVGLPALVRTHAIRVAHGALREDRWQLEDVAVTGLLDRLLGQGRPLERLLGKPILSGLKTGYNEAYYIDSATRTGMLCDDPTCGPLFRKFLRGRDIARWFPAWNDQWHIVIPSSHNKQWPWGDAATEEEAEAVFSEQFPAVHAHLKQHEKKLRARRDKGKYWWELRACDYYDEFDSPKIVVQCIAYYSRFAFDGSGHYVNNKAIVIPSDDPYLLAVLNSRVTWWIVNRVFQHMKDEGLSVDVQFLRKLPIPEAPQGARARIAQLVRSVTKADDLVDICHLETELDSLIVGAFGLTATECDVLVSSLPPRDPVQTAKQQAAAVVPGLSGEPPAASLALPTEQRIAASSPDAYAVQAILWLLREAGGRCERVRFARALALLSRPDWVRDHAPTEQKTVAAEWRQAFNETGYRELLGPVLGRMLGGEVVWRREGEQAFAVLAKPELLLDRPWIAADARLVLSALEGMPASILTCQPMQQMEEEIEALLATG